MAENLIGQPEFGKGAGLEWTKDTYGSTAAVSENDPGDPAGAPGGWTLGWTSSFQVSPRVPGDGIAAGDILIATGWATEGCTVSLMLGGDSDLGYSDTELGYVSADGAWTLQGEVPADFEPGDTNGPRLNIRYVRSGGPAKCSVQALQVALDAPEPDPEPEPEPTAWTNLAKKTAQFLGRPEDETLISQAEIHSEIVAGYVAGYTRGRGFDSEGEPKQQLRYVIVSATARLSNNPEQVAYYQAADYTEKPAVLAGWTLPELAILHNYRRRSA